MRNFFNTVREFLKEIVETEKELELFIDQTTKLAINIVSLITLIQLLVKIIFH